MHTGEGFKGVVVGLLGEVVGAGCGSGFYSCGRGCAGCGSRLDGRGAIRCGEQVNMTVFIYI